MELVADLDIAYFRPCLTMPPGGDAAKGSDILQTANRNLTHIKRVRPQSNVGASMKYVRPPAMNEVLYSFNSLGGLTWSTTMSSE